ncbi:MAG TPA: addiction module antidote protein, HigA family [Thioploca sp.]|nr:addiction module antidote protein, HigA family [Thioploca sp.]
MSNTIKNQYNPEVYSAPGETVEETIEYLGMPLAELSERTDISEKTLNDIINGEGLLTPEVALKLELALDVPADFWLNMERNYRESLARLAEKQRLESQVEWLKFFPIQAMTELNWVRRGKNQVEQLKELLCFFGIAATATWQKLWGKTAYFQSPTFQRHPQAVSAWLRQGERLAQKMVYEPYNVSLFQTILPQIRALTTQSPNIFVPKIQRLCAQAGVAVVFVPELPQVEITTITRRTTERQALIQFSERYQNDGNFWLTFFQQVGHLLLPGNKQIFLEDALEDNQIAQEFAAKQLIPEAERGQFALTSHTPTHPQSLSI